MIFVDTSIWVSALRRSDGREGVQLAKLLDSGEVVLAAPVRIELLSGATGLARRQLRSALAAIPVFLPHRGTWDRIDQWLDRVADAGERFGFADLLIGAIAADHGAALWSRDADFARMARLGLIKAYAPR